MKFDLKSLTVLVIFLLYIIKNALVYF